MYTRFAPAQLPADVPTAVMERSPHACFALTESLDISYCNAAWDRFARENGGGTDALAGNVMHKPILQYIPFDLRGSFESLFTNARALGRPQAQDYECSSAQVFRLYRMQIYPLQPGSGFAVVNSLRVAHPHTRIAHEPDETRYVHDDGLMRMCANCRRTRRVDDPAAWDWVPEFVEHPRQKVSHSVCPFCAQYYYGAYLANANLRDAR
ncbi:MAG: hypothetical protein ACM3SW_12795 [Actinomycetota bacterium]